MLKSKGLRVKLKDDLNLEVLLFGSQLRRLWIFALYDAAESGDHWFFIRDVSKLANKSVSEILERNSLTWWLKSHSGTILTITIAIVGLLVTISPWLIPLLGAWVKAWSSLLGPG
jgi:hypothetical protein